MAGGVGSLRLYQKGEHSEDQRENTVKKMHRLYRIGALVGAILLPVGAVLATGTTEASASTGSQYCDLVDPSNIPACLNAWGGGPFVNVETSFTSNPPLQNNLFQVLNEGGGIYQIQFVGNGMCVGDAGNLPGNADTGLVVCNTHTGAGWGTLFNEKNTCGALYVFYNLHWGGYLGPPAGYVNGSHFYLNKPSRVCFSQE